MVSFVNMISHWFRVSCVTKIETPPNSSDKKSNTPSDLNPLYAFLLDMPLGREKYIFLDRVKSPTPRGKLNPLATPQGTSITWLGFNQLHQQGHIIQ